MTRTPLLRGLGVGSLAFVLLGCGDRTSTEPRLVSGDPPPAVHSGAESAEHAHPSAGPHQGRLIELGRGVYHAELSHAPDANKVIVYLLDKQSETAVTSADAEVVMNLIYDRQPRQFLLAAEPQEGDAAGQASRYSLVDETLFKALESPSTTGRLSVNISGKPYSGKVDRHVHGEHQH